MINNLSGIQAALAAARIGDKRLADEIELAWRNAWRILPRLPRAEMADEYDRGRELLAFSILDGLIEWSWITPCPRCWRRLAKRPSCTKCFGYGHVDDEREIFYADLDGNVVESQ